MAEKKVNESDICKIKESCAGSSFCYFGDCCMKKIYENLTAKAPAHTHKNYRDILKAFALGRNIFLTAAGGAGKSHLLNQLRKELPDKIIVTATTGIAALGVGGATLHSTLGLGLGKKSVNSLLQNLNAYKLDFLNRIEILAIDEVSMLSGELLDKCNEFLKLARMDNRPFGGIQVLLIGDFCQLPPVDTETTVKDYCFYSKTWQELNLACFELKHNFRQQDDPRYANILSELRLGRINQEAIDLLQSRIKEPPEDVPRLYATNAEVRQYNYDKLVELGNPIKEFKATYSTTIDGIKRNEEYFNSLVDKMKKSSIAEDVLQICEGARVMLTRNLDVDCGLVNGSLGYIDSFCEDGSILVNFDNEESRWVKKAEMDMVDAEGKALITQVQYPLKLATSLSVHKAQGCTLDKVFVDFDRFFEVNQAYVALSRVKSSKGLYIKNFKLSAFKFAPQVLQFYGVCQ